MKIDLAQLERQNNRFAIGGNEPTFLTYDDPHSLEINRRARKIIQIGEVWNDPSTTELAVLLRTASSHSRSILLPETEFYAYFEELSTNIALQIERLRGLVPLEILTETEKFNSGLVSLAQSSFALRSRALSTLFTDVYKQYLVVGETSALRKRASIWAQNAGDLFAGEITALGSLSELESEIHDSYDEVVILGAPSRLVASIGLKPTHLRALVTSGIGLRTTFCYPSWLKNIEDSTFWLEMYSGIAISVAPTIQRKHTGELIETQVTDDDEKTWDEELLVFDASTSEVARLVRNGSVACSLIQCVDGLVFPIEKSASSVGVISAMELEQIPPNISEVSLDSLVVGDALIARVDSSERESLRANTLQRVGEIGTSFLQTQSLWKSQLVQRARQQGWAALESQLRQTKMSVNPRPEAWSAELSLGPGNPEDFQKLLQYLGWSAIDSKSASDLVRAMWNELIHEGHLTRRAIQTAITGEHLDALRAQRAVRLSLEDHGDAAYVIAPIVSTNFEAGSCDTTQLRRFVVR